MTIDCIIQHTHPAATALGAKPSTDAEWSEFLEQQRVAAYDDDFPNASAAGVGPRPRRRGERAPTAF